MSHTPARYAPHTPRCRSTALQISEATDQHLLDAVRAGHDAAYGELYRRHEQTVRKYARSLVAAHEVDDLISESFARMLQALRRSKGPVDHPIRYLLVTARTTAVTLRQRGHRQHEIRHHPTLRMVTPDDGPGTTDDQLIEALVELAPRWRTALWLNVVEGLTPAEIGRHLDLSPAGVSALLYRAKRALRCAYLAKGGEPPPSFA